MKALARCYLWWPSLDKDIKAKAKSCFLCCAVQNTPQSAPLHPWTWPSRIWQRLHIDYAQKGNRNFLVIIDSYSKWLEVFETRNTSAESTCDILRTLFASYGLPEEVVSDNGPQFTSSIFKSFLKNSGVKQTLNTSVPSCIKRCSRAICTDFEAKLDKTNVTLKRQIVHISQACNFLIYVQKHATHGNR